MASFDVLTLTLNPAVDRTVTIPRFTPGAVNRVEQTRDTPGGKGVNVASVLADHGHRVAVTGFLGRENCGVFEVFFAEKQIADRFVRIAGATRVGIKIVDPAAHTTTDINFPGLSPSLPELAALRKQISALDAPWAVLAGSLPPGVDSAFHRDLAAALKATGRKVLVDTSGEALRRAVDAAPTILKPNLHELEELMGERLSSEMAVLHAARSFVARGIALVVVSMGKAGACFVTAEGEAIARPPEVEIQSSVGAGDALVAGILAAQLNRLPLEECARRATAFAVCALTRNAHSADLAAVMQQIALA
ncbi:MAG: 1-phosphofructokinase [Verrucomicrobiota bacterium]